MRLRKDTKLMSELMNDEEILLVSEVSDALSHPIRIKIYQFIMQSNAKGLKVCNKDVVLEFDYSQATISQHLKKLLKANLLQLKNEDRYSYYYANIGMLQKYLDATRKFNTFNRDK